MITRKNGGEDLAFLDWLSIISGIIGIMGFIFAIWVWLRADTRVKEITAAMQAMHDIADSALWESQCSPAMTERAD
jgi:hypothetical protein